MKHNKSHSHRFQTVLSLFIIASFIFTYSGLLISDSERFVKFYGSNNANRDGIFFRYSQLPPNNPGYIGSYY